MTDILLGRGWLIMFKNLFCILFSMTLFTCTTVSNVWGVNVLHDDCSGTFLPESGANSCRPAFAITIDICGDKEDGLSASTKYYVTGGICYSVHSCDRCPNGYDSKTVNDTVGGCTVSYLTCEKPCNCKEDECSKNSMTWSTEQNGDVTQTQIKYSCVDCQCKSTTLYRCVTGYYGEPIDKNKGCTPCPVQDGVSGTTSGPGKTKVTECYIPAGSATENKLSSDAGTYYFPTNCNHK